MKYCGESVSGRLIFSSIILFLFQFIFLYSAEPASPVVEVSIESVSRKKARILFGGHIVACILKNINSNHTEFMLIAESCNKAVEIFSEEENAELLRLFKQSALEIFLQEIRMSIYDKVMSEFDHLCVIADELDNYGKVVAVASSKDPFIEVGMIRDTLHSNGVTEFISKIQAAFLSDECDEYFKFILNKLSESEHPDSSRILTSLLRLLEAEKLLVESKPVENKIAYENIFTGILTLYFNRL